MHLFAILGVTASFTTTPAGGAYAPKNVTAVWVEDQAGKLVKTIGRWSAVRTQYLLAWVGKATLADTDAVSGATRLDHAASLTVTWDLKNKAGTVVPDGTYTIRMELADANATTTTQNHEASFTFVKSASPQMQTGLASNGFTNVTINFQPVAATCNNGVVDPGETCDGASCPTTCAASSDPCMDAVLVGSPSTCDAACTLQPNGTCDGDPNVSGGCNTGRGEAGLALAALGLLVRRRSPSRRARASLARGSR